MSQGDELVNISPANPTLGSPFDNTLSGKIQRGMEHRRSGKSVTISLKDGEEEMRKSIIQERPLPELPIKT